MRCPQCKLVEMFVNKVNEEAHEIEYICKKCGTTLTEEYQKKE